MAETVGGLTIVIRQRYKRSHILLLDLAEGLTDAELHWSPQSAGNSMAWMLWHLARFADGFQAEIARAHLELTARLGQGQEMWFVERMAARWGLDATRLGCGEAGIGMAPDEALHMRLPNKLALLDYVCRCFALANRAVDAIPDACWTLLYASPYRPDPVTIVDTVLAHLQHERYHLGQMRYLVRMMRGSGQDSHEL